MLRFSGFYSACLFELYPCVVGPTLFCFSIPFNASLISDDPVGCDAPLGLLLLGDAPFLPVGGGLKLLGGLLPTVAAKVSKAANGSSPSAAVAVCGERGPNVTIAVDANNRDDCKKIRRPLIELLSVVRGLEFLGAIPHPWAKERRKENRMNPDQKLVDDRDDAIVIIQSRINPEVEN